MADKGTVIKHIKIEGRVQGVGFRYFTRKTAQKYSINGWVMNMSDGTVEAVLAGKKKSVADMMDELRRGPATARVKGMKEAPIDGDVDDFNSFTVKR
jgi:acylphosphatase